MIGDHDHEVVIKCDLCDTAMAVIWYRDEKETGKAEARILPHDCRQTVEQRLERLEKLVCKEKG